MTLPLELTFDSTSRTPPAPPGQEAPDVFSGFDCTLDWAIEAARPSKAPILIVASTRLDGTGSCSEH
jgi:hypothetical protein